MSAQVPRLSHTSRQDLSGVTPRRYEHSIKLPRTRYTRVQLLLFIGILTAAYTLNPQLEIRFIMTCVSALFALLLVRLVFTRQEAAPANNSLQRHAPQPQAESAASTQPRTPNLSGVWVKDKAASDSMEPTLKLMQVNRLIRTAVKLVKGIELQQTGNSFEMIVLSGILWFKIKEQYPLTGEVRQFKRRDLRKGLHRGTAEKLPDGAVCITLEWDDPLGGVGTDVFYIPAPGVLYVDSTILMQGQTIKYRTIYNKQ